MNNPFVFRRAISLALVSFGIISSIFLPRDVGGDSAGSGSVYLISHKSLTRVEPELDALGNSIALADEAEGVALSALAGKVWVLGHSSLLRFDSAGVQQMAVDLRELSKTFGESLKVEINPYDDTPWVASKKELLHLSTDGKLLHRWVASGSIEDFKLDIDGSIWVLEEKRLVKLTPLASIAAAINLGQEAKNSKTLAIDGLGGRLWIAGDRYLAQFSVTEPAAAPRIAALPNNNADDRHIRALTIDPLYGVLWVVTKRSLLQFDRHGALLADTNILEPGGGNLEGAVFEPVSRSIWIAEKKRILRFSSTGQFIAEIPFNGEIEGLAATPFVLQPAVNIAQPADGALLNNPKPLLQLKLGARCNSVVCDLPQAYTSSFLLDVTLDGLDIGGSFQVQGVHAYYQPAGNLGEGPHYLSAKATDLFGHASTKDEVAFTVDTIPPAFQSVSPADGTVFSSGAVTISGSIDDPTGNVSLFDQSGALISHGSASFAFAVVLKAGLNVFTLTARDPAGNTSSIPLRLTLSAISVKITGPTSGAVVGGQQTIVKGTFQGPSNTGITVNNVVAQTQGNTFVANVPLSLGGNTVTASAVTLDGQSATDSIVVTVNQTSADPIALTATPESGVAPLTTRFTIGNRAGLNIASIRIDFDGNGTIDFTSTDPSAPIEFAYQTVGTFEARVEVTDSQNKVHSQKLAIVVHDPATIDQLFTGIWGGMNNALVSRDVMRAGSYLNNSAKSRYMPVFEALKPRFASIVASYSSLVRASVTGDIAEYSIVRLDGSKKRLYLIYFLRDADGVWRLDAM